MLYVSNIEYRAKGKILRQYIKSYQYLIIIKHSDEWKHKIFNSTYKKKETLLTSGFRKPGKEQLVYAKEETSRQ